MPTRTQPREEAFCCEGKLRELGAMAEGYARREPVKFSAVALLVGLLFTVLPIGKVLGALVRLSFAMLRPFLLALGAIKALDEIERRRRQA